ncbi:MAG: hypothetical protein Q7R49_06690 [Candidatus Daviesbacteria bacterium]|nr:hypothetical protein [Candidatus Daviesbacteria bacterium]
MLERRCENCILFGPNQEQDIKAESLVQTLIKSGPCKASPAGEIVVANWKCSVTDRDNNPLFQPK